MRETVRLFLQSECVRPFTPQITKERLILPMTPEYDSSRFTFRKYSAAMLALSVALLPFILQLAAWLLNRNMSYNRWDNFEGFTPSVWFAHTQLLQGSFPHWNPYQFLGEPLHAQAQSGVLYPPYTIACLLLQLAGLEREWLPVTILLLHLPFAGLGYYQLLRYLKVRPTIAIACMLAAVCGGYPTAIASVWIFIVPLATLIPWIILFCIRILEQSRLRSSAWMLAGTLVLAAFVGNAQLLAYIWIGILLFAVCYAILVLQQPRRLIMLWAPLSSAVLGSMPVILPAYRLLRHTARQTNLHIESFLSRSLAPDGLKGILTPILDVKDGFMNSPASVMTHQGAWVMPALMLGFFLLAFPRMIDSEPEQGRFIRRAFCAALIPAVCLMVCALGSHLPFYRLTHGIPVWSSFRWPFKFLLVALPFLALASGLALELCARRQRSKPVNVLAWALCIASAGLTLSLVIRNPSPKLLSPAGILSLCVGLPIMLSVAATNLRPGRIVLLVLVLVEMVGVIALCHDLNFKTYHERYGIHTATELGFDPAYRIIPASVPELRGEPPSILPNSLFFSATAHEYASATGCEWGMTPQWVSRILPANVFGVLPPETLASLLPTHLAKSLNIRYVVAGNNDYLARTILQNTPNYSQVTQHGSVIIYQADDALPRAYGASHVFPYTDASFRYGMIANAASAESAFVETETAAEVALPVWGRIPQVTIKGIDWQPNHVRIETDAPMGGFVMVSQTWYPEWRAWVDGKPTPVMRANGALQGIVLHSGARKIELRYVPDTLYVGIGCAMVGVALMFTWSKMTASTFGYHATEVGEG